MALASSKQEQESNDAEWDARHQEAVDSAEQWKEFADKLSKEKEEQQQQLSAASADFQVKTLCSMLDGFSSFFVSIDICLLETLKPNQGSGRYIDISSITSRMASSLLLLLMYRDRSLDCLHPLCLRGANPFVTLSVATAVLPLLTCLWCLSLLPDLGAICSIFMNKVFEGHAWSV